MRVVEGLISRTLIPIWIVFLQEHGEDNHVVASLSGVLTKPEAVSQILSELSEDT